MPAATTTEVTKPNATDSRRIGTVAWSTLNRNHPGWSVDELLIHPRDAMRLCALVCESMSVTRPHDVILRALVNARKHGAARGTVRKSRRK